MERVEAILLVEGQDDQHVVGHLLQHHGVAGFDIQDKQGCDQLLKELPVILKGSVHKHIGIVLDADEDLARRWHRTRSVLLKAGYQTIPLAPAAGGTLISEAGKPNIGVWLMPNNSASGELEDFVAQLIPQDDACWPIAVEVVNSLHPPSPPVQRGGYSQGANPHMVGLARAPWRQNRCGDHAEVFGSRIRLRERLRRLGQTDHHWSSDTVTHLNSPLRTWSFTAVISPILQQHTPSVS